MPEIRVQATRVDHWRGPKTEWRSYRTMGDRLGNTVHMRLNLEGPNPHITAWRENRQGVKFGDSLRVDWQGNSGERQNRPDDATMWGAGRSAFFKLSTHANEGGAPVERDCDEWRYEWPNVRDPWPGEEAGAAIDELEGAAHAMAPEVGGGGGGGVTREEVEAVLRAELPRYFEPKVTAIVDNMPLKTMSTLGDLYDPEARNHEKPAYRALVVRAQDKAFKRNDDDFYLIINKLITGQDPNHPIENEGFRNLIKELMHEVLDERGTEPTEGGTP